MPLETGTHINSLVPTNPANGDGVKQGDDHIRLIKATLKNTFPNIDGEVSVTPSELNALSGTSTNVQDNITNIYSRLSAAEADIATKLTTSTLQTAIKAVDGPGSGIDADTVDGVQLSGLVQTSRSVTTGGGLSGGGDLSANRVISHANTADTADLDTTGTSGLLGGITFDSYGHVTSRTSRPVGLAIAEQTLTGVGSYCLFDISAATGKRTGDTITGSAIVDTTGALSSIPGTWLICGKAGVNALLRRIS